MDNLEGIAFELCEKPKKLIFLLHGYGDNAENFIHLAQSLNESKLESNFFAPNAPFVVPQYPLGRQWFDPYPNGIHFNEAGSKEKEKMRDECEQSINLLKEYINNLCSINKLNTHDCFLIGFSQGAMMVFELGNALNKTFAGCVMLSGRVLSHSSKVENIFTKTPLLILHGDKDEVVSPESYHEACKITRLHGFHIDNYLIKDEGHTISPKMLQIVQNFIKKYV